MCQQIRTQLALFALCCGLLFGCTINVIRTDETLQPAQEYPQFANFERLEVRSGFEVTVRQGATRQVRIATTATNQPKLNLKQDGKLLSIEVVDKDNGRAGTVEITMPVLTELRLSGGCRATINGFTGQALIGTFTGGSTATLSGGAPSLTLDLAGGSQFNGYDFPVGTATVDLTGGSQARLSVATVLTVRARGGSQLFYRGTPTVNQDVTGGSVVRKE